MKRPKDLNKEIVKAARKKSRDEEIALHGKQICFRTLVHKNPKAYDRNKEKRNKNLFSFYFYSINSLS